MKLYQNGNRNKSNFEPYEERKEIFNTENNKKISKNLDIDGIINDIQKKGFNNSQIKNIMISIENNIIIIKFRKITRIY